MWDCRPLPARVHGTAPYDGTQTDVHRYPRIPTDVPGNDHPTRGAYVPAMDIDPHGDVPVYEQLAAILRGKIASGEIPARRPLPSKKALVQEYGVSAGTVDHAVRVLKAEGLVRTVTGRGLYVVPGGD